LKKNKITAPVINKLINAIGTKPVHPNFNNWSYLNLGKVQRTNIKNKINPTIFIINTPTQIRENNSGLTCAATQSIPGKLYPPKYKVAKTAELTNIAIYSANRNIPNFIEEYSWWYPIFNSLSASGRSKGTLPNSAKVQIKNIIKPKGCLKKFHVNQPSAQKPCCCSTIVRKLRLPVIIIKAIKLKPNANS